MGVKGLVNNPVELKEGDVLQVFEYERLHLEGETIYLLQNFKKIQTDFHYRENETASEKCDCGGAGRQLMMIRVINSEVKDGKTFLEMIPLAMD